MRGVRDERDKIQSVLGMNLSVCIKSIAIGVVITLIPVGTYQLGYNIASTINGYRDCPEGEVSMKMSYEDGPIYHRCVKDWIEKPKPKNREKR